MKIIFLKGKSGNILIPLYLYSEEDWHLYTWLNHPLVPPLEIQCSISMEEIMSELSGFHTLC